MHGDNKQQMRTVAKKLLRSVVPHPGQRKHARDAARAYAGIIANAGVSPLTAATRRTIRDYAVAVLGSRHFTPWLEVYSVYRGQFLEGWIPDDFFEQHVLPKVNADYRNFGIAKTLSRRILATDLLPDVAYRVNGLWLDVNCEQIPPQALHKLLFQYGDTVFAKSESSAQGLGISILRESTFDPSTFALKGNLVVQRAVKQAAWFEAISPGCVATLRVTTASREGRAPQFTAAHFRMGVAGQRFIESAASLKIPVLGSSGELSEFASDPKWCRHRTHPDTGVAFAGMVIPGMADAIRVCLELHARVPQIGVIGWDCAISDSGPELLEWNTRHPGIKFEEATVGPAFVGFDYERLAAE